MQAIAAFAVLFGGGVTAVPAQEIITNPDLAETDLSKNEAVLYFTRRLPTWSDGKVVQVFVLPDDHPLHKAFTKRVLGLFPYQLRRVWDRQLFSGTGQVPIMVDDEEEMIRRVPTTPGAIGYARSPQPDNVRVQHLKGR